VGVPLEAGRPLRSRGGGRRVRFGGTAGMIGAAILLLFILMAILAPVLSPYSPHASNFPAWQPPSAAHLLGTDDYGQDVLTQLLWGARTSIVVGVAAGILASSVGVLVGLLAGYKGGWLGEVLMRLVDLLQVIPTIVLLIIIAAFVPTLGLGGEILIIGFLSWVWMARSIRSQALSESARGYVEAARVLGMSDAEIMFKEVLPNLLPVILANLVLVVTGAILAEASLDFLGIGSPNVISWGTMLSLAFSTNAILYNAWWWIGPPGFCIATLCFAFILLGNGVLAMYAQRRGRMAQK